MKSYEQVAAEVPLITQKVNEICVGAGLKSTDYQANISIGLTLKRDNDLPKFHFVGFIKFKTRELPTDLVFNLVNYFMSGNGELTLKFDFSSL
jgi:hypothetical protein